MGIRVGEYRILYEVDDKGRLITVGCVSFQLKQYSHVIPSGVFGARNLWCRSSDLLWQLKDSSRWSE